MSTPISPIQLGGKLGSDPTFLRVASTHMALLTQRIDEVIEKATGELTDLAGEAGSDSARTEYMDAAVRLRKASAPFRDRFLSVAGASLRSYCTRQPAPEESPRAASTPATRWQDMRVLDDGDVAETLAAEAAIQRAERRYQADLHCLGMRLAALAGLDRLDSEHNPLGPSCLVEAVRAALKQVDCELAGRLEIIYVFDRRLLRGLEALYDPVNEILAQAGILPNIRWEPRFKRFREGHRTRPDATLDQALAPDGDAGADAQAGPAPGAGGDRPGGPNPRDGASAGHDAAGAPGGANADGPLAQPEADVRRGYLDGWLFGSIQWLLSRRRRQQGDLRDASTPGVGKEQLSRALDSLQAEAVADDSAAAGSIEAIKRNVLQRVGHDPAGGPSALSLGDENLLDAVGMMFDFMGNDSQLPAPFQASLGKLQIPYLKAALNDPDMLSNAKSPAKLLLNEMAEAGLGWNRESDQGGRMLAKVEAITGRILRDYRDDPGVFAELLEEFHGFKRRLKRRAAVKAKRETEAVAGRERLQLARREVGQIIVEQTRDVQLPPLIGELLRKSWAHVMVLTLLEHGRESKQWKQAVAVTRELVWSVTFDPAPEQVKRLRTRLPALAKALAGGLKKVGYSETEIQKLQFKLKRLYADLMQRSGSDRVVIEASADGLVIRGEDVTQLDTRELEELPVIDDASELAGVLDSVRGWRPGQWVMLHRQGDEPLRVKLSWVSPITGRYLFVNQRGAKALERSAAELAEDLIGDRLQLLDGEEMVSRAMSAVAGSLQDRMADAA